MNIEDERERLTAPQVKKEERHYIYIYIWHVFYFTWSMTFLFFIFEENSWWSSTVYMCHIYNMCYLPLFSNVVQYTVVYPASNRIESTLCCAVLCFYCHSTALPTIVLCFLCLDIPHSVSCPISAPLNTATLASTNRKQRERDRTFQQTKGEEDDTIYIYMCVCVYVL